MVLPPPIKPFAVTWMNTGRDGAHGNVVGSVMDIALTVDALTVTGTPSTTTTFPAGVGAKLFPTRVTVPPGRSGTGFTETISGALALCVSVTLMVACAVCASTLAVIAAVPTATPVTSPVEFTAAISGVADCQPMVGSWIRFPPESRTVAMSCAEPPGMTIVAVSRENVMDPALGFFTTTCATPIAAPDVARTVPMPACRPVTTPEAVTLTTVGESEDQTGVRSVIVSPLASRRTALACVMLPTTSCAAARLTLTLLTAELSAGPSA